MTSSDRLNSNSVDIPLDEAGTSCVCDVTGFRTDYPPQLQNTIYPTEFHESITNINRNFPQSFYTCLYCASFLVVIASLPLLAGIALLIAGLTNLPKDGIPLIIIGCVIVLIGVLCCIPTCRFYGKKMDAARPLREAVEEESKKYESRHCQWRLISKTDEPSFFRRRRQQTPKFHIIIDINQ